MADGCHFFKTVNKPKEQEAVRHQESGERSSICRSGASLGHVEKWEADPGMETLSSPQKSEHDI